LLVDLVSVLDRYPHHNPEGHPQFACNKDLKCAVIPEQAQGGNLQPQTIAPKELTAAQPAWWKNMRFEWTNKLALGALTCRSASHGVAQIDQDIELSSTQPQHHHTKLRTLQKLFET
jgi:hypothetical protein